MVSERKKLWSIREVWATAEELKSLLAPYVERIEIAGSLRRRKSFVHDIELLFIPKTVSSVADLFGADKQVRSLTDAKLEEMINEGILSKRLSSAGHPAWGPLNKLALHCKTQIAVDLFATTLPNWWNSLVIRTGGKASNLQLTMAANKKGWSFEAYGSGFHLLADKSVRHESKSEEDIFTFVGLPYLEPALRP